MPNCALYIGSCTVTRWSPEEFCSGYLSGYVFVIDSLLIKEEVRAADTALGQPSKLRNVELHRVRVGGGDCGFGDQETADIVNDHPAEVVSMMAGEVRTL